MKRIRAIAVLPTLFTLGNLVCGFFAIVVANRVEAPTSMETPRAASQVMRQFDPTDETHNLMLSGWLVFLAMVFDALDGHVARLTRTPSEFGAQLDSLADLVTFGVAPAFMLVKMCHTFAFLHREAVWMIAAVFVTCAAMRLARFNVESEKDDDHLHFSGLPTPAAGAVVASFAIFFYTLRQDTSSLPRWLPEIAPHSPSIDRVVQTGLPFMALLVALLMVSRIPYPHVVNQVLRGQKSFGYVVGLVFALGSVAAIRGLAVPIVCCTFVVGPPIAFLFRRYTSHAERKAPIFD
jgi:CDP-diacylglycerol--serine O-phosphatidyltransferase